MIMLGLWFFGFVVFASILTVMILVAYALLSPRRYCPGCSQPLPRVRKPATRSEMLHGGWTCSHCGTQCDRHGRKLQDGPVAMPAAADTSAAVIAARYEQIARLKALLDAGALSQQEFEREKQKLLVHASPDQPSTATRT